MYYQPSPPPQNKGSGGILWGVCIAVLVACLGASGTLLYKGNQKNNSELQQAVYQAVMQERSRALECVQQTPVQKEIPKTQLTGNDGSSNLP